MPNGDLDNTEKKHDDIKCLNKRKAELNKRWGQAINSERKFWIKT